MIMLKYKPIEGGNMVNDELLNKIKSKLVILENKKEKINAKEKEVNEDYIQINAIYEKYKKENKISKILIIVFSVLVLASLKLVAIESIFAVPAFTIGVYGALGSCLAWNNLTKLEETYSNVNNDAKYELERLRSFLKEIEELKALVNEKLFSNSLDDNTEEMEEILEDEEYLDDVIDIVTNKDQKIRKLYIHIAKL